MPVFDTLVFVPPSGVSVKGRNTEIRTCCANGHSGPKCTHTSILIFSTIVSPIEKRYSFGSSMAEVYIVYVGHIDEFSSNKANLFGLEKHKKDKDELAVVQLY